MLYQATCVRIPVLSAQSVYIGNKNGAIDEVAAVQNLPGAVLEGDVANQVCPQAVNAVGSRDTFVGRIRKIWMLKGIHIARLFQVTSLKVAWNSVKSLGNFTNVV